LAVAAGHAHFRPRLADKARGIATGGGGCKDGLAGGSAPSEARGICSAGSGQRWIFAIWKIGRFMSFQCRGGTCRLSHNMLVVNPGGGVTSECQDGALFPYVLKDFRGQAGRAREFLTRSTSLDWLVLVLLQEIGGLHDVARVSDSRPASIVEEAARWIAQGRIPVAESLRGTADLVFSPSDPRARDFGQGVRFARKTVAVDFLGRCLVDPAARTAVDAALAFRPDADRQSPADASGLEARLANQLMLRRLGLFPVHGDTGVLRIAWIEHSRLSSAEAPATPAPRPRPIVAQIMHPMLSTMPDLPDEMSAQARTIKQASVHGVPFCEECARAAAARASA
jgi:hypothetical protein